MEPFPGGSSQIEEWRVVVSVNEKALVVADTQVALRHESILAEAAARKAILACHALASLRWPVLPCRPCSQKIMLVSVFRPPVSGL
jgi:hypothetical protein